MIQNVEVEQNILGTFLVNNKAYFETMGQLSAEDFSVPVHREIFEVMESRFNREELVSPVTLKERFQGHDGMEELGGVRYLARMAGSAQSIFAIRDYVKSLRSITRRRNLHDVLSEAQNDLLSDDKTPEQIAGFIEASLIADDGPSENNIVSMMAATVTAVELASESHMNEGVVGSPTGLADLDKMTGGYQAGELVLLGGRPSMGKTAVAMSMALATARSGKGVIISSLEMTPDSLALRAISNQTACNGGGVAYTDAKRGVMADDEAKRFFGASQSVGELPIEILPANMRDIGSIYSGVRKASRILSGKGAPVGLIVIDYLQLISGKSKDRFQQIAEISIALKGLALKTGVPVLALSQLSRALEGRENKRPMLSDLRESGQLEQDADMVMFCYRDEYYLERDRPDETNADEMVDFEEALQASKGKLEIIVAKQRMGEIGTVNVNFDAASNFLWDEDKYQRGRVNQTQDNINKAREGYGG